jgi:transposase-like protein
MTHTKKCIQHLENVRWAGEPWCPHCDSARITPRKKKRFYYHCNGCNKDFSVLVGTIFEASHMPLPKWFQLIATMLNHKKGISAKTLERQLGVRYKAAWMNAMKVRCAMVDQQDLLEGIVELDEAYLMGAPRHRNIKNSTAMYSKLMTKRGAGTKKIPIVGIVQRGGGVKLEVKNQLSSKAMLGLLRKYVSIKDDTIAMTDESKLYKGFSKVIKHLTVNHSKKEYARKEGELSIHTNTIEGVWQAIKGSIRGQYHVLSRKYLPFYLAEFAYKYNRRLISGKEEFFNETLDNAVTDESCVVNYKPKRKPDDIVYGEKDGETVAEENAVARINAERNRKTRAKKKAKIIASLTGKQKRLLKTNTMSTKKLNEIKKQVKSKYKRKK